MSKNLFPNLDSMIDILDIAVNVDKRSSGTADAIAHVGALLSGSMTRETIDAVQNELLDPESEDYDEDYATGYQNAWKAIYDINFNDLPWQGRKQVKRG